MEGDRLATSSLVHSDASNHSPLKIQICMTKSLKIFIRRLSKDVYNEMTLLWTTA